VARGQCGRQPRIDRKPVRRDHGPSANFARFASGGLRMGQIIGENRCLRLTLDDLAGIDPARTLPDYQGRSTDWLEDREPIVGLSRAYGRIRLD
jgi:hypothetical protein